MSIEEPAPERVCVCALTDPDGVHQPRRRSDGDGAGPVPPVGWREARAPSPPPPPYLRTADAHISWREALPADVGGPASGR